MYQLALCLWLVNWGDCVNMDRFTLKGCDHWYPIDIYDILYANDEPLCITCHMDIEYHGGIHANPVDTFVVYIEKEDKEVLCRLSDVKSILSGDSPRLILTFWRR